MGRKPIQGERRAVPLSQWFQQEPGRAVTRAQLYQVIVHMVERRLQVERVVQHERKWRVRFWRWLTGRRGPTEAEEEAAAARALDPEARTAHQEEAPATTEPEPPAEELESGVKFREKRRGH